MALIPLRRHHETQAIRWGFAASLCCAGGAIIFWVIAVVLATFCGWHGYHLWRMRRRTALVALFKLPELPITDALDLQWLTWAQWKEPRTRAYLREKRPNGDYRICDIHDLMVRMSYETDVFTRRFGDPDDGWEALEARRKQERHAT